MKYEYLALSVNYLMLYAHTFTYLNSYSFSIPPTNYYLSTESSSSPFRAHINLEIVCELSFESGYSNAKNTSLE